MDPLAAFALACNVIQVVDFASRAASLISQIYKNGATEENIVLEDTSKQLHELSKTLSTSCNSVGSQTSPTSAELQLQALALESLSITEQLQQELNHLKSGGGRRDSLWKSWRALRKRDDIKKLGKRLHDQETLLNTGLLVRLREQNDAVAAAQEANFVALDKTLQQFISRLAEGHTRVSDLVRSEHASTRKLVRDTGAHLEKRLDDLRLEHITEDQRLRFLNSLRYEEMNGRKNQISATYPGTYEWIFDETVKRPWPSFKSWLERGRGVYFIEGKAGSGKSTLMKFIINDKRTKQALKAEAPSPSNEPVVLSFFFWLYGTSLQRTLHGLMSSLLYQLLEGNAQATIPLLRKDVTLWKKCSVQDWDVQELSHVLQKVVRQLATSAPLCIFLDGLDEFNDVAEPTQLLELIRGLSLERNVRICVSSRPEQHIRNELEMAHLLRLQDLTEADIRKFVLDKLGQAFQKGGVSVDLTAQAVLINKLIQKAEGVFLWVSLALHDILRGLNKQATFAELSRRVSRLPAGIEQLYESMLQRLGEDWSLYQQEAALYFKTHLVLRDNNYVAFYSPRSLIFYTILVNKMLHGLPPLSASNIDLGELLRQCRRTELRIASCCAGMLEISWSDTDITQDDNAKGVIGQGTNDVLERLRHYLRSEVNVSHRTVLDFLLEKPAGQKILAFAPANDVAIFLRAIESQIILQEAHILPHPKVHFMTGVLWIIAGTRLAISGLQIYELVHKMQDLLHRIYNSLDESRAYNEWEYDFLKSSHRYDATDFLGATLEMGIPQYFEHGLGRMLRGESNVDGKHLKAGYKDYLLLCHVSYAARSVELLSALLNGGADPNATFYLPLWYPSKTSPWVNFLAQSWPPNGQKDAIESFLAHGARLDELIVIRIGILNHGLYFSSISRSERFSKDLGGMLIEFNAASLLRAHLQGAEDEPGVLQYPSILQVPSHQQVLLLRVGNDSNGRGWVRVTPQTSASIVAFLEVVDPLLWPYFDDATAVDWAPRKEIGRQTLQFIQEIYDQSPLDRVNDNDFLEQRGYYKRPEDPAVPQGPFERFEDVTEMPENGKRLCSPEGDMEGP